MTSAAIETLLFNWEDFDETATGIANIMKHTEEHITFRRTGTFGRERASNSLGSQNGTTAMVPIKNAKRNGG